MEDTVLNELKSIELEIFDEFVRICKKYDLSYFLMGGTLLGAVRHKGFIPWDDDIDVGMPRSDYEKFILVAQDELKEELFLQNYHSEPNCGLVFSKIRKGNTTMSEKYSAHIKMHQGIWIDIFPYDYLGDKKKISKISFIKNLYIIKCGYKFPEGKSKLLFLPYLLMKIFVFFVPISLFIKQLENNMHKKDNGVYSQVYPYGGAYGEKDIMPTNVINNTEQIEFEGRIVSGLKDYDYFLSRLYGDYMKLPPENQRHGGMHYLKELKIHN